MTINWDTRKTEGRKQYKDEVVQGGGVGDKDGSRTGSRKLRGRRERGVGRKQGRNRGRSVSEKRKGEDEKQGRDHAGKGKGMVSKRAVTAVTTQRALAMAWALWQPLDDPL